jgi:LPXTG-motif cell wall-anchored protein
VIGSGVADANGAFGGTFTLPSDLEAGAHDVTLSFTQADGTAGSVSAWFSIDESGTVTAVSYDGPTADPTSALPTTGSDSKRLVVAGGAFALLGSAVAAVAARRRQDLARRRMPD